MKDRMKKIVLASICTYGMSLLGMQVNIDHTELLSSLGHITVGMETTLRPNGINRAEILDTSSALEPALETLSNIERQLSSPTDVKLQRRIQALRARIFRLALIAIDLLQRESLLLSNQIQGFNAASQAAQDAILEHLNFVTQLYNAISALPLNTHDRQRLIMIEALIVHMRTQLGL